MDFVDLVMIRGAHDRLFKAPAFSGFAVGDPVVIEGNSQIVYVSNVVTIATSDDAFGLILDMANAENLDNLSNVVGKVKFFHEPEPQE